MDTFKVELSDSEHGHSYLVNGIQSPRIYLKVGVKYTFEVNTQGHPFYLTTDALGGSEHQRGAITESIEVGNLEFTPKSRGVIYYQCDLHTNMGYKVHID